MQTFTVEGFLLCLHSCVVSAKQKEHAHLRLMISVCKAGACSLLELAKPVEAISVVVLVASTEEQALIGF